MKIVLDIESGGFSPKKSAICEIALIIINDKLEIQHTVNWMLKPYIRCPIVWEEHGQLCSYKPEAMAVHKIPMEEIENGTPAEDVAEELYSVFNDYDVVDVIGHNVGFDIRMVLDFMSRFGYDMQMSPVDTIPLCKQHVSDNRLLVHDYKLPTMLKLFDIENKAEHRALGDAMATLELYKKLVLKN